MYKSCRFQDQFFKAYLFLGTVGIAKTILYEISDDSNQAIGMSILAMSWGAGIIIGPAVGGKSPVMVRFDLEPFIPLLFFFFTEIYNQSGLYLFLTFCLMLFFFWFMHSVQDLKIIIYVNDDFACLSSTLMSVKVQRSKVKVCYL